MEWAAGFLSDFEGFVRDYGVIAVTIILALEACGAPVPGETLLIFAAYLAAKGEMSLPGLMAAAWAGSVIGDNVGYVIGRSLGRAAIARFGAKVGLTEERFAKVEAMFARYGGATVVFARFFSILRQLNGIVAGTLGMHWHRFLACNTLGAALWVGVWVLGPYYLAEHADRIKTTARGMGLVGIALSVALLVALVAYLFLRKARRPA